MAGFVLFYSLAWYPIGGFVVSKLWCWFVVPFGAPEIGMWWMAGILVTISAIRGGKLKEATEALKENYEPGESFKAYSLIYFAYALCLLSGWLFQYLAF